MRDGMAQDQTPLIDEIDSFLARHEMSPVTFGRKAMGDPHFVRDLRGGRRLWPETEGRVRDFMATYQPPEAAQAAA